jgi:phosphoribosylformylglycinamidine (FGAM) synthase PurS component
VAVDVTYRQGVEHPDDRTVAAAVKLFLHSQ